MTIKGINPATGEELETYPEMTDPAVEAILRSSAQAFEDWKRTPIAERTNALKVVAEKLRLRRAESAELMAREMGKPITQGRAEIDKCAWVCDYYAQEAETFLQPEIIPTDARKSLVAFEPLGI